MSSVLDLSRRLLALSQTGLHFTAEEYDRERYREIGDIAAQLARAAGRASAPTQCARPGSSRTVTRRRRWTCAARSSATTACCWCASAPTASGRCRAAGPTSTTRRARAVLKEIEQESGFTARVVKLAAVYDRNKHNHPPYLFHAWKLFFICEITGGEARTSYETTAVEFFPLDGLPELSTGRSTAEQIRRMYQHHLDPHLPTEFD